MGHIKVFKDLTKNASQSTQIPSQEGAGQEIASQEGPSQEVASQEEPGQEGCAQGLASEAIASQARTQVLYGDLRACVEVAPTSTFQRLLVTCGAARANCVCEAGEILKRHWEAKERETRRKSGVWSEKKNEMIKEFSLFLNQ